MGLYQSYKQINTMASDLLSVTSSTFNPSKLTFVRGMSKNGRNAPINMKYDGQTFQLLLPKAPVRYMSRTDQQTGDTSHTLSYTLLGCDNYGVEKNTNGSEVGTVYNALLDLENTIIQAAIENSPQWFGKKRSEEGIRESFKRIVNVSTDKINGMAVPNGKYAPSWYIKFPVYEGEVKIGRKGIVDKNGVPIPVVPDSSYIKSPEDKSVPLSDAFPKGCQSQLSVTGSLYTMTGGGFGVSWKLRAAKVYSGSEVDASKLFGDSTESQQETVEQEEGEETQRPSTPVEQQSNDSVPVVPAAPARKKRTAAGGH
jgi:sporulation protein YlmC with PRC-barrel domain